MVQVIGSLGPPSSGNANATFSSEWYIYIYIYVDVRVVWKL